MTLQANPAVASTLLDRYKFYTAADLATASAELHEQLKLSMVHMAAYGIPLDQHLPSEIERTAAAPYVHPLNIATALINVANSGHKFGTGPLPLDPAILLYDAGQWVPLATAAGPQVDVKVEAAAIPTPPVFTPPTPPPVAAIPPLPPTPSTGLADLVGAALAAPATTPATPLPASPPAPLRQDAPAPPSAAATTPASPAAPATPPSPPSAAPPAGTAGSLPDPSVMAERIGESGRPQKSPFEKKVEARNKVAAAPFWLDPLLYSAPRLFTVGPAQALDPSSTGSGPVQAYAMLVALTQKILRDAPGDATVAELRLYLGEVESGMLALDSHEAISQLVVALIGQ